MRSHSLWQGMIPPQYLYARRRFAGIALDPPDFEPGSWIGAGKALFDAETERFLLTGKWHFYLSVDTGEEFIWGGVNWETLLLTADSLEGPWSSHGLVLRRDQDYDFTQALDSAVDIVDGRWMCLYKAIDGNRHERPALATSFDRITWKKHGVFTTDGRDKRQFISGTIFSGTGDPVFVGLEIRLSGDRTDRSVVTYDKGKIGHGGGYAHFVAFRMDVRTMNLETIHRALWTPGSEYEHGEHPCLGYSSLVYDPLGNRVLMYVEALDPKLTRAIGLNETVERVLVYETKL